MKRRDDGCRTHRTLPVTVALLCLLGGHAASAQQPTLPAVSGHVVEAGTGRAVARARVEIVGSQQATVTDDRGAYGFLAVPPGSYTLRVQIGPIVQSQPLAVVPGSDWVIDLRLAPTGNHRLSYTSERSANAGGEIRGRVTFGGRPVPEALVFVREASRRAITTADGSFTLRDVPTGSWQLRVERVALAEHALPVTLGPGEVLHAEIALAPLANPIGFPSSYFISAAGRGPETVSEVLDSVAAAGSAAPTDQLVGRVLQAGTGLPLPGARITLVDAGAGTISRASGEYVVLGVAPGTYRVRAERPGSASVESEITLRAGRTQLDFVMGPAQGGGH